MREGLLQLLNSVDPLILLGLLMAVVTWGIAALLEGDITGGDTYRRNREDIDLFGDGDG